MLDINHLHDLYGTTLIGWFLVKYWSSMQSLKGRIALSLVTTWRQWSSPFSSDSAYNSVAYKLSSENQIVRVGRRSQRIDQSQCMFPCFVIGLVLLLLLVTLTTQFTLDHK